MLLVISAFLLVAQPVFGQRELEVQYPEFGGITPVTIETALPDFVVYIFSFFVGISGLIALGSLVYGGVRYVMSVGNPTALGDAQSQMLAGFLGVIIILGAYLIAQNINPQLVIPEVTPEPAPDISGEIPGVYLIYQTPAGEEKEIYLSASTALLPAGINEMVKGIRFVSGTTSFSLGPADQPVPGAAEQCQGGGGTTEIKDGQLICTIVTDRYGAVLHEHQNFTGECSVITNSILDLTGELIANRSSSVTTFIRGLSVPGGVWLCEETNAKREDCFGPYKQESVEFVVSKAISNDSISSIIIDGPYMAVLFDGGQANPFKGVCEVFSQSDPNFRDNPIGRCGTIQLGNWGIENCLSSFKTFPIKK